MPGPASLLLQAIVETPLSISKPISRSGAFTVCVALKACSAGVDDPLGGYGLMTIVIYPDAAFLHFSERVTKSWKPVVLTHTSLSRRLSVHNLVGHSYGRGAPGAGETYSLNRAKDPTSNWNHMQDISVGDVTYRVLFDSIHPLLSTEAPQTSMITAPLPYHSVTNGSDVALVFPFEKAVPAPAVLWAKKVDLMKLSHFFDAMFTGGFSENDNVLTDVTDFLQACRKDLLKVVEQEKVNGPPTDFICGDSDAEDDDTAYAAVADTAIIEGASASSFSPITYITIRSTAYKTYEGLLRWALTGKITFAPLKSTNPTSHSSDPSCKSVYRLAHQLGIKALEDIAAANFQSQLSHINVMEELFSSTCFAYPVLRDAGMKVLEREWGKVKKSGGLDSIFKLVESDQGDAKEMTKMALEILKRSQTLGS